MKYGPHTQIGKLKLVMRKGKRWRNDWCHYGTLSQHEHTKRKNSTDLLISSDSAGTIARFKTEGQSGDLYERWLVKAHTQE